MGLYLTPGHTYSDTSPNNAVNGANLNEHVSEAVFKTTAISSQTLKDPAALSDEILINDGGSFKKETWQQVYALMIQPGTVIQTVYAEYTANTNLLPQIPFDDTIPQNSEGTEIISASITPRFSTSTILASFFSPVSTGSASWCVTALFRDSVVNAIASQFIYNTTSTGAVSWALRYMDSPATTSAITYKIRVGPDTGTIMRLNGDISGRAGGGSARAVLTLQEIKV